MKRFISTAVSLLALVVPLALSAQEKPVDFSDNFEVRRLNFSKFTILNDDQSLVNMGTRGLTIISTGASPADCNYVSYTPGCDNWEAETDILLFPTSKGGLVLKTDNGDWWGITANYKHIEAISAEGSISTVANGYGRYMHLMIECIDGTLTLYSAPQKTPWRVVANGNPGVERKPADKWMRIASVKLPAGAKPEIICMMAMDNDIVSFRDFWFRVR